MFGTKQRIRKLLSLAVALSLFFILINGVFFTIEANAGSVASNTTSSNAQPVSSSTTPVSSSSSSSSSSHIITNNGGALSVTSYRTHVAGQTVTQIMPGMAFTLEVRLHDSRITPATNVSALEVMPRGKMNTSSYRPDNPTAVSIGRDGTYAPEGNGGYDYVMDFTMIYLGEGNTFLADIYYEGPVGSIAPMTTITLQLNNSIPTPSSSSSEIISSSSEVVRGTAFALKDANYGDSAIDAGSVFPLTLTMLATNGANNIENVSATIVPDQNFSLASGASTIYFGTATPNQSIPLEFELLASSAAENGSYKVTINLVGVSALDGQQVTASVDISIPVIQPDRFVVNNFVPPDFISVGDSGGYVSIELVNMGKSVVSNVIVSLEGDGLYALEGQSYVGNFNAGIKNNVGITLMGDVPGTYPAELVVSYETASGEVKEIREPFQVEVGEAMMTEDFDYEMPVEEESSFPALGLIILIPVLLLVGGGVITIVLVRKKRKAKEAELEDDDDEDL